MIFTFRNIYLTLKTAQFCKATFYILESIQDNFPTINYPIIRSRKFDHQMAVVRVKRTLQYTDFRLVLAPEIQVVCEENVTTAQNDHSLYSSIDGSNSQSIMRFSLC